MRALVYPAREWSREEELCRGLRRSGFAIDSADSRESLLQLTSFNPYDVVLLFAEVPGSETLALCQMLRETFGQWLLLAVRGASSAERAQALDGGVDECFVGPLQAPETIAKIRALTSHKSVQRLQQIQFGLLTILPSSRIVMWRTTPLRLTAREYSVLALLGSRAGEVVSRTELLDRVWDDNHNDSFHSLDEIVSRIRRKLQCCPGVSLVTYRSVGYGLLASTPGAPLGQLDLFEVANRHRASTPRAGALANNPLKVR